ncbi:hypothetical protein OAU14_00435 [bacterium]|nr:hypothetical protein [bacterium]
MIVGLSESDVMTLRQMAAEFRARNPQVGTFTASRQPTVLSGGQVKIGKANADITAGTAGTVNIWRRATPTTAAVDTGETVEAYFDWLSTETISAGKEVLVEWFKDEGIFRIIGSECE